MDVIRKTVSKLLRQIADKIDGGNCEIDEEQALHIMATISHEPMSKDTACSYLNISRSKFDFLVAEGKLPEGKKRRGFKEKIWFKDELSNILNKSL